MLLADDEHELFEMDATLAEMGVEGGARKDRITIPLYYDYDPANTPEQTDDPVLLAG